MKLIEKLSRHIGEEIHDAECYVKWALELKDSMRELAMLLYELSKEEMDHMARLHKAVTDIIANYRKEHGEPPEVMQAVYNILHERHIDDAAAVKTLQAMFREE